MWDTDGNPVQTTGSRLMAGIKDRLPQKTTNHPGPWRRITRSRRKGHAAWITEHTGPSLGWRLDQWHIPIVQATQRLK